MWSGTSSVNISSRKPSSEMFSLTSTASCRGIWRQYIIAPDFNGSVMSVTIAVSVGQAVFFGTLFEPIMGKALVATATVGSETRLIEAG